MRFLFLLLAGVGAVVRVTPNHVEAECDRDYELKENVICNTTMYDRWTATSDAQGTFAEMTLRKVLLLRTSVARGSCAYQCLPCLRRPQRPLRLPGLL